MQEQGWSGETDQKRAYSLSFIIISGTLTNLSKPTVICRFSPTYHGLGSWPTTGPPPSTLSFLHDILPGRITYYNTGQSYFNICTFCFIPRS
jgi:hypothetical protein